VDDERDIGPAGGLPGPDDEHDTETDADAEGDAELAIIRRWLPSTDTAPAPKTRGLRSVFDLATLSATGLRLCQGPPRKPAADGARFIETQRDAGTTRVVGGQYPDGRWTAAREASEIARRAKQRPPKPTRMFKTRSKKLLDLIGSED